MAKVKNAVNKSSKAHKKTGAAATTKSSARRPSHAFQVLDGRHVRTLYMPASSGNIPAGEIERAVAAVVKERKTKVSSTR